MTYLMYLLIAMVSSMVSFIFSSFIYKRDNDLAIKNMARLESFCELKQQQIDEYIDKYEHLQLQLKEANEHKFEALRQSEIAKSKLEEFDKRLQDFEQNKKASLESSKAAIFEVANQLSSKLVSDHRRESEEVRKNSLDKFNEVTQKYQQQFENVLRSVSTLSSQVKESKEIVDVVKQALLSPGGAGNLAEITLENILKSSGLIEGKDFKIQYSFDSGENRQRPDAIIFLPSDNIFVIDSKASKFFHESGFNAEDAVLNDKLLGSMKIHLKQLASKEYKQNIIDHLKKTSTRNIKHVSTIMFMPSESVISKIQQLDHEFLEKAWQMNIFPAGPAGLVNILSHAKFMISEEMQIKNHEIILDEVKGLMTNLFVIAEYARKLGSNLQSATLNFDKFAGSFNRNIISKTRKLSKLGVSTKSGKELPPELERFQLMNIKQDLIEVEPEGDVEVSLLKDNKEEEVV
jgi:DNA recombination protein RmuC